MKKKKKYCAAAGQEETGEGKCQYGSEPKRL